MRIIIIFFIFTASFLNSASGHSPLGDSASYLSAARDIPLAPSLHESDTLPLIFDTPAGRIIVVETTHMRAHRKVTTFYRESLPNLGWRISEDAPPNLRFIRGSELLRIEITEHTAHFYITPR